MMWLVYAVAGVGVGLALAWLLLMLDLITGMRKLQPVALPENSTPVTMSVVIAARNEEKNIEACLSSLFREGVPEGTEVIVVNDHSDDATAGTVRVFGEHHPQLRLVELGDEGSGKKAALAKGIGCARGELIVLTDADCTVPGGWLQKIRLFYLAHQPGMIIMPVHLGHRAGMRFGLQALEFFSLTAVTAASAMNGKPLLCNGAALAYKREVFVQNGGFSGNEKVASGDDMLLLQKVKGRTKVLYLADPGMAVHTPPAPGLRAFFDQRTRWASKTKHYTDKHTQYIAALVFLMSVLPLLTGLLGLLLQQDLLLRLTLALLIFKAAIDFLCLFLAAKFFRKTNLLLWFLPGQLLYPFYVLLAGSFALTGSYTWKGRSYSRQ